MHNCIRLIFTTYFLIHVVLRSAASQQTDVATSFLQQGIHLVQQSTSSAADPTLPCASQHVLHMSVDDVALPPDDFTVAVTVAPSTQQASQQSNGVLFTAAGLSVSMNRGQGTVILSSGSSLSATYHAGAANTTVSLAVAATRIRLCFDFNCPVAERVAGFNPGTEGWLSLPSNAKGVKLKNLVLGDKGGAAATAWIENLWVSPKAIDMLAAAATASTPTVFFSNSVAVTSPPHISLNDDSNLASLVVGKPVNFGVSAASGSSRLGVKLRLTFYGVAPSDCAQNSCGDLTSESYSTTSTVQVNRAVIYSRAGRYIVRAQASDMIGGWASKDFELLIRKVGDTEARAPCCRTTANIVAQQLGRPIDPVNFRPSWINSTAAAVGWDLQYLAGPEDMEAERLFDYGLLAPINTGPVTMLTCPDTLLAGPGSPEVYGAVTTGTVNADSNQGHAKRVAIVPQGFNWATDNKVASSDLPSCVMHWSPWVADTPYGRRDQVSGQATCSYTCTSEGIDQLVTRTGTFDRWSEAIVENSYGILSFLSDPVVLPVLYMPLKAQPGDTAFSYSEAPLQDYMKGIGVDMFKDFHTVLVLSPRPNFINNGITAWANADGSPLIFVMRCNPQHYYLVHEAGHRLGMPHATLYKLDAGPEAQAPTSPLGTGVMQDTYSDRLDIMACCKGDYSLYNRILSGWVPASERLTLGLSDMTAPQPGSEGSMGNVRRYTLWPYDRPESKGKLKGVSLRLENGKILVLGYRSTPFWQDVRVGRNSSRPFSTDRLLQPEHMRDNVAGLSVEYSKRYYVKGVPQWSVRGLLDFNMAFARYPNALPRELGAYPPNPPGASFTLLREGDAWLDEEHNLLIAVERVAACSEQPLVPVYRYGVYSFYGFRGEDPGTEAAEQADYTGYVSSIKCLNLRVVTGVTTAPGTLDVQVRMQGMDDKNRLVLGGDQCGFPVRPRLRLTMPDDVDILAIVWRDNLNRTVASDVTEVDLPPLAPLAQSSALYAEQCNSGCDWRYHVKVLAADGAQTQIDITVGSVSLSMLTMGVTYSYYLRRSILTAAETHNIPVVQQPPVQPTAPQGRQLLDQPTALDNMARQVFHGTSLPDISCSKQWSVSMNVIIPTSQLEPPVTGSRQAQLFTIASGIEASSSWPAVKLKVSSAGTALLIQWGRGSRELPVAIKADSSSHVVIVRDGVRLGAWINSNGGWLIDNVLCLPDSQFVNYCSKLPSSDGAEAAITSLRFGDDSSKTGITVNSIRVYNYALPRLNQAKESTCVDDGSCGRFLIAGWQPPAPSSVPSGTISLQGAVPQIASTRISLHSSTYYLMVGPWTTCSVRCGGGWQTRDVRCMQLSADPAAPVSQVPLEDCPFDDGLPASSQRCNTVACPWHSMQLLTSKHSSCGRDCQLVGPAVDAAQLVCINSLGQPQPLGQCCSLCNATDWADIPWNSTVSSPWSKLAAAGGVQLLQPAAVTSTSSLADVVSSGLLPRVCDSKETCSSDVRWQLSDWSSCSKKCGGGVRRRTASCINTQSGVLVSNVLCQQALGAVQSELLEAPCRTAPCELYTWKLDSWSTCSGTAEYGHSSRSATCIDSKGGKAAAGASSCPAEPPTSTAVCLKVAQSAVCRPSFVSEQAYGDKDCYGHGTCTMLGCSCKSGWHGQFCEISAECPGVMTKSGTCCESAALDQQGACCPIGSVLDSQGQCCTAGDVDACGVCNGRSLSVDIRGTCCAGVLDALGSCCTSSFLDECGICDGDGTSCRLMVRLLALLPKDTNISQTYTASTGQSETESAWHTAVQQLLQPMLARQVPGWQLQLEQVSASWVPEPGLLDYQQPSQGISNRQLLSMDDAQDVVQNSYAVESEKGCMQGSSMLEANNACQLRGNSNPADGSRGSKQRQLPETILVESDTGATSRKLLAAGDWQRAYISIFLQPYVLTSPQGSGPTMQNAGSGLSMAGLGSALLLSLQTIATGTALASEMAAENGSNESPVMRVLRVVMAERVGVCGNGICEVGERALLLADRSVLYDATSPCPQDCPLSLMVCPTPTSDTSGDLSKECGGHGKCLRSQGVCDCFTGYTGDACEQCLAGFYPHAGQCLPQYINGRNIFDVVVDVETEQKHLASTIFLVVGGVAAACILASLAWTMYRWLVLGETPKLALGIKRLLWTAKADKMQKKYLLNDELELSSGRMSAEDSKGKGAVRRRASAAAAAVGGGGSAGWDGDLLKAIRANLDDEPGSGNLPVSTPPKSRLSRVSGGFNATFGAEGLGGLVRRVTTSAGGSHRGYTSLGGAEEPVDPGEVQPEPVPDQQPPRSSMTLAEVYGSLQRGISQAGSGVARVLSQGVSRLSTRGSGYERMITDDEGLLMVHNNWTMAGERAGVEGADDSSIGISPAAAALDNSEDILQATAGGSGSTQHSNEVMGGVTTNASGSTIPQLARIRTRRTSRQSVSGAGGNPTRMSIVSNSASGSPSSGRQQLSSAGFSAGSGLRFPSTALTQPPVSAGAIDAAAAAPQWRTRADYQAGLASASPPLLDPHLMHQLKGWRSPSEPGGKPGLSTGSSSGGFVSTPDTATDPTSRAALEAFGARMERWFSPGSQDGTNDGSNPSSAHAQHSTSRFYMPSAHTAHSSLSGGSGSGGASTSGQASSWRSRLREASMTTTPTASTITASAGQVEPIPGPPGPTSPNVPQPPQLE